MIHDGRWTGARDRNGFDIRIGDIVEDDEQRLWKVVYTKRGLRFFDLKNMLSTKAFKDWETVKVIK